MEPYTVAFIGHRYIDDFRNTEHRLDEIVAKLIMEKEYVCFYVGRNGDFDQLASSSVLRVRKRLRNDNSALIWAVPYVTEELNQHYDEYLSYYNEIVFFDDLAGCHPKAAIQKRNRLMIDRADLVIAYVKRETGGAYQSLKYAERAGKTIVNIAKLDCFTGGAIWN